MCIPKPASSRIQMLFLCLKRLVYGLACACLSGLALASSVGPDCNGNSIDDATDISSGTSLDCNANGIPDECDIASGTSLDCDLSGTPDECDLASGVALDCNANSIPDRCDVFTGTSLDCNLNFVPDECEPDCNSNGIPDNCDITGGTSLDCNADLVPDECQPDCNGNGIPDDCDISSGTSFDCNGNLILDECDITAGSLDCDLNGVPDDCQADCNGNGTADECDISGGTSLDCDLDGIPDDCEPDCNGNGIADDCDISSGSSSDVTGNGIPDDCEIPQQTLALQPIATGFSNPTWIGAPASEPGRLYVLEQFTGLIHIIDNGVRLPQPFLDVSHRISTGAERGLLGMAFHPDYGNNGRLFVAITDLVFDTRVLEFAVTANPNLADPIQVQTIAVLTQPGAFHNGGCIRFGPDGMLYLANGDGGGTGPGPAQDLDSYLGKMLRLDIDMASPFIPPTNPYVGVPGALEGIWALGHRHPWRFSFDRLTGDMWIADVGAADWEEIDFQPAGAAGGRNYGWPCMEGAHCLLGFGCVCMDPALTMPIHEVSHATAFCAMIGGFVYRGSAIPSLQGTYLYADYCTAKVQSLRYENGLVTHVADRSAELNGLTLPTSFGEDADGELFIVTYVGDVYKIVQSCQDTENFCVGAPNSIGPGAQMGFSGSVSIAANDLVIEASDVPPGEFGIFIYGPFRIQAPFGDGYRCVGSPMRLLPVQQTTPAGTAAYPINNMAPPQPSHQINVGSEWHFQYWYRDPGGPLGSAFNLTNGLSLTFCP
jgi:glucose/arabinose dehydrogenase